MSTITFVTWDGGGNLGPAIGLAQELAARGHRCRFVGYDVQRGHIERQGFAFERLAASGGFDVSSVRDGNYLPALVRNVFACPEHVGDVEAAVSAHACDVVVVDVLMQGALAAAEAIDIPAIAFVHSAIAGLIAPPTSPMAVTLVAAVNELRAAVGRRPIARTTDAWSQLPSLVTTIRELDTATAPASAHYVGPITERRADATWMSPWPESDRPPVIASFSTTTLWDQRGRLRNTLAALADEPVRVLVTGRWNVELPPNAVAVEFVPHALVLPSASAMVTHCGHGTVCAALAHSVPIVGMPNKAADQPYLARRVEDLGAGIGLDGEADAATIRAAVRRVLDESRWREGAKTLATAIRRAPGAAGSALEIERVATRASTTSSGDARA